MLDDKMRLSTLIAKYPLDGDGLDEWMLQWQAALAVIEQELNRQRQMRIIAIEKQTEAEILKDKHDSA